MIEFFIDVAQECFNIGNFNSLMAIISECGAGTPPWGGDAAMGRGRRRAAPLGCFGDTYALSSSAGMNMSPVSRLKKTWNKVNTDKFEILEVR